MATEAYKYLQALLALAKTASFSILDLYQKSRQFSVQSKADASPLTQADIMSHEILVAGLMEIAPDIPILSEEDPDIAFAQRRQWQRYWLVDPLDGTREYIQHTGDFAINIALIDQHEPVLGIIYIPVTDTAFYACRGLGAFKQEINARPQLIQTQPWVREKTIVAVGRHYKAAKLQTILSRFGDTEIVNIGSSMKFCRVAEGKADLYPRLGPTFEWDTASGQIIIEEAGGAVVDLKFNRLLYNTKESLLNPHFIAVGDKKILEELRKINF